MKIDTNEIINMLIAHSDDKIWATELALDNLSRRLDFWTLEPHLSKGHQSIGYEIKVSRADFKRDSEEKQKPALEITNRFWYVTPPGIIRKDEIPSWAGLMEWDGTKLTIIKKPPNRPKPEPSWSFVTSLIRNSGETRRDMALMKKEIQFYKNRIENLERQEKIRKDRSFGKYLLKSKKLIEQYELKNTQM